MRDLRSSLLAFAFSSVVLLMGCIRLPSASLPPEEAILAGSWEVTGDTVTNLEALIFTFNDRGELVQVVYELSGTSRITDTNPRGDVSVRGDSVVIDATIVGNGTVFNGILNNANTQINGTLTTRLQVGSIIAEQEQGAATLTRQ